VWIDTHCHLGDSAFDADRPQVVERMRAAGVGRALVIESDMSRLASTLQWASSEAGIALATGCHPHDANHWTPSLRDRLEQLWRSGSVAGAGEMGLDYHYDHSPRDVQQRVFREQLALAVACDRPVIIHAREADADVVTILREQPEATVVLHSFSSGSVLRDAGLRNGWYFSFSGMVTFKNWRDQDTARAVPDDRLLLETDAPYLAPVPHRGKRNEPAFVTEVGRQLAELRGGSPEALAATTSANAERLFWNPRSDTGDRRPVAGRG
jgi:TatD DNase family protein